MTFPGLRSTVLPALLALGMALSAAAGARAANAADPDWPCVQRLVPNLTAAGVWSGPVPPPGDAWRQVPDVAALVTRITPSAVREEAGLRMIGDFAAPLDAEARRRLLPLVLSGTLAETNQVRGQIIERIGAFARRQRGLADTVQHLTEQLDASGPEAEKPDTAGDAKARQAELQQRVFFATKTFQDAERTLRYMCEVPVRLEARFGAYARALEAALPAPP
ncbi:hypothetical protein EBE87_21240 [Pseudoroseomonas wenyumeiae]|uniref:Uncharacterized protein n=2 Tax=Teichococcus wenyumeiae TaxID=2478470 RepID=A0A3A9JA64_9PROT|nr:hypothetical protein D6Z83_10875 [Pseudoroseomonas wenyumeiae]RMI19267.1 hypothetical protein EBE87_21240 [Pseudoroseomonas wenyumeiae]